MKLKNLVGPALAGAFLLGLAACQGFSDGVLVEAKVARTVGDPCRVSITLYDNAKAQSVTMLARLETPECLPASSAR